MNTLISLLHQMKIISTENCTKHMQKLLKYIEFEKLAAEHGTKSALYKNQIPTNYRLEWPYKMYTSAMQQPEAEVLKRFQNAYSGCLKMCKIRQPLEAYLCPFHTKGKKCG